VIVEFARIGLEPDARAGLVVSPMRCGDNAHSVNAAVDPRDPDIRGTAQIRVARGFWMGCLFLLITLLSPRLAIVVLWLFTDYVSRVFSLWLWPLLGLVFLPWTTLIYILVAAPAGGITFWGWLMVGLGLLTDISGHVQAYTKREEARAMVQPAT